LRVALPDIFRPLAIAGLFRLPASLWLTDDYHYNTDAWKLKRDQQDCPNKESPSAPPPKRYTLKYFLVIGLRALFLLPTMALLFLALYYFKPNPRATAGTASTLLINMLYVVFLTVTLVTTSAYTIRGQSNTTVIPCINSIWYMCYTCLLFSCAFLLLILTALQTRKTSCGQYTTYPVDQGLDHFLCSNVSVPGTAIN
jgi:magnesium-transporting ATPase (P-type)